MGEGSCCCTSVLCCHPSLPAPLGGDLCKQVCKDTAWIGGGSCSRLCLYPANTWSPATAANEQTLPGWHLPWVWLGSSATPGPGGECFLGNLEQQVFSWSRKDSRARPWPLGDACSVAQGLESSWPGPDPPSWEKVLLAWARSSEARQRAFLDAPGSQLGS